MHFGLIGKSLKHSFSKSYFADKFRDANLPHNYHNCELESIEKFPTLLSLKEWSGFNVTIPYKEQVLNYVDVLSPAVKSIGAANVISIHQQKLYAYNTDYLGFRQDLQDFLSAERPQKALVLGSGGASKAIVYALQQMGMEVQIVGRKATAHKWDYHKASTNLKHFPLVVNCSPVGTSPDVKSMPPLSLPSNLEGHFFYDLIYNPAETLLLKKARLAGAKTRNGQQMLILQAEASYAIWTKP